MKIAYIDVVGGLSGDMLIGALIDAGLDPKILEIELRKITSEGWNLSINKCFRNSVNASNITFNIEQTNESFTFEDFYKIVFNASIENSIKSKIVGVIKLLENAEKKVHSEDVEDFHLHELGSLDTLLDVAGFIIGLSLLEIEDISISSIPLSNGQTINSHGAMPSNTLAATSILLDHNIIFRTSKNNIIGELITPTGAAIVCYLINNFEPISFIPETIGYGAGDKDIENYANVTSIWIGETNSKTFDENNKIILLETNIDDSSGEIIGHVQQLLFDIGCLDVWSTPIFMKKNRPGVKISVLIEKVLEEKIVDIMMKETTTLGIRRSVIERHIAPRKIIKISTIYGDIKVKVKIIDGQIIDANPEYEDCLKISKVNDIPLREVYNLVTIETQKLFS